MREPPTVQEPEYEAPAVQEPTEELLASEELSIVGKDPCAAEQPPLAENSSVEEPHLAENPVEEPNEIAVEPKPAEKVSEFVPEFTMVVNPKDARVLTAITFALSISLDTHVLPQNLRVIDISIVFAATLSRRTLLWQKNPLWLRSPQRSHQKRMPPWSRSPRKRSLNLCPSSSWWRNPRTHDT